MVKQEIVKQLFETNPEKFRLLVKSFRDYSTLHLVLLQINYAKYYQLIGEEFKYLFQLATRREI